MNAPSKDIKQMLVADSSVDTTSYPISIGKLDESKANCSSILDIPSGSPQLTMDRAMYEFLSVQMKVRCTNYSSGMAFLRSVVVSLHGRAHESWNGSYYSLITCLNGPGFHERDNQRTIFIANFNIQRRAV